MKRIEVEKEERINRTKRGGQNEKESQRRDTND